MSTEAKAVAWCAGTLAALVAVMLILALTDVWPEARDMLNEPMECDQVGTVLICEPMDE